MVERKQRSGAEGKHVPATSNFTGKTLRELDAQAPRGGKAELNFDRNMSLQQLDGQSWGEPSYPSYLVTTCFALRHKPLKDFTTEDLRIMIGQGLSLAYLIPIAIEHLSRDILAQGDFYPGDLLSNVIHVEPSFWREHPDLKAAVQSLFDKCIALTMDSAALDEKALYRVGEVEAFAERWHRSIKKRTI